LRFEALERGFAYVLHPRAHARVPRDPPAVL
jgi:hypothetical protein